MRSRLWPLSLALALLLIAAAPTKPRPLIRSIAQDAPSDAGVDAPQAEPDAGPDAGPPDAGTPDIPRDAGSDAAPDAPHDAPVEATPTPAPTPFTYPTPPKQSPSPTPTPYAYPTEVPKPTAQPSTPTIKYPNVPADSIYMPSTPPQLEVFPNVYNTDDIFKNRNARHELENGIQVQKNAKGDVVGISWINGESPRINFKTKNKWDPPNRGFRLSFQGRATQDAYFYIYDQPTGRGSDSMESCMMFFPRKFIPKLEAHPDGKSAIAYLPTGEKFVFDLQNKEIVSGVFYEQPIDTLSGRKKYSAPRVQYTGPNLWIRFDSRGSDPRLSKGNAVVHKGSETCEIPVAVFWKKEADRQTHFRFATDNDLDSFLHRRCGFGL